MTRLSIPLLVALALPVHAPQPTIPIPHWATVEDLIIQESLSVGVQPYLALNLAWRESRFNPLAVSKTKDAGVFQLSRHTVRVLHVAHPLDARQNIVAGVGLLSRYLNLCHGDRAAVYAFAKGRCLR